MRVIWHRRVNLTRHGEPFNKRDRGRRAERRFREEQRDCSLMEHDQQPARTHRDGSRPRYETLGMDTGGIAELVQLLRR